MIVTYNWFESDQSDSGNDVIAEYSCFGRERPFLEILQYDRLGVWMCELSGA